ncbi:MAG: hypothetical protein ACQEQV_02930 [Fibrobacterota bacterium]
MRCIILTLTVLMTISFISADPVDEAVFALNRSKEIRRSGTILLASGTVLMASGAAMASTWDSETDQTQLAPALGGLSFGFGVFLDVIGVKSIVESRRILERARQASQAEMSFFISGEGAPGFVLVGEF